MAEWMVERTAENEADLAKKIDAVRKWHVPENTQALIDRDEGQHLVNTDWGQEQIADYLGKSQSYVSQMIRYSDFLCYWSQTLGLEIPLFLTQRYFRGLWEKTAKQECHTGSDHLTKSEHRFYRVGNLLNDKIKEADSNAGFEFPAISQLHIEGYLENEGVANEVSLGFKLQKWRLKHDGTGGDFLKYDDTGAICMDSARSQLGAIAEGWNKQAAIEQAAIELEQQQLISDHLDGMAGMAVHEEYDRDLYREYVLELERDALLTADQVDEMISAVDPGYRKLKKEVTHD